MPGTNDTLKIKSSEKVDDYAKATKKDTTVFDTPYAEIKNNMHTKFIGMLDRGVNHRKSSMAPPGYYDNLIYDHRYLSLKYGLSDSIAKDPNREEDVDQTGDPTRIFRVGDCMFVIPPEFIAVNSVSSHETVQGLRQENSSHIKNGYIKKDIQVSLMLNGLKQINGYKVESPIENVKYEVDGLRALISQFRYTPFVPVENMFLNMYNDIDNVALRNITISTIEGFPDTLNVTLSMQEFNATPYINIPNAWMTDCIDWDLYRWYTQRPLFESHHDKHLPRVSSGETTKKFKFYVLEEEKLQASYAIQQKLLSKDKLELYEDDILLDLTDRDNYSLVVDSNEPVSLSSIQISMSNLMPQIQLSDHQAPTYQYLGATDSTIVLNFETRDSSVVAKFDELNRTAAQLVRDHSFKAGLGFIRIENELINMTGCEFVIIDSLSTSTIPGFPGLYQINMSCISFDINRVRKEKLHSFRPFPGNRLGNRDDLITPHASGFANKLLQDAQAELEINKLELYPDLCLPKYDEVDNMLKKIISYRRKHKLEEVHASDSLKRPMSRTQGSVVECEYNGFVDPDFYLFIPVSFSDMEKMDIAEESFATVKDAQGYEMAAMEYNEEYEVIDYMDGIKATADRTDPLKYKPGFEPNMSDEEMYRKKNIHAGKSDADWVRDRDAISDSSIKRDPSKSPSSVKRYTGSPLVDVLIDRFLAGCWYVMGTDGQTLTDTLWFNKKEHYGITEVSDEFMRGQYGKQVFDCSGFISWGLRQIGIFSSNARWTTHTFMSDGKPGGEQRICVKYHMDDMDNPQFGDLLVNELHMGIYIGKCTLVLDGKEKHYTNGILHAASEERGILITDSGSYTEAVSWAFDNRPVNRYSIKNLKQHSDSFIASNPNFYLNTAGDNIDRENQEIKDASKHVIPDSTVLGNFGPNHGGKLCDQYNDFIIAAAKEYNLDPNMIKAFMMIESTGRRDAVNVNYNCHGLMQINLNWHIPKFPQHIQDSGDFLDPYHNIRVGCQILSGGGDAEHCKWQLDRTICAYNGGYGNTLKVFVNKTMTMPTETANYINKYKKLYGELIANGGNPGKTKTLNLTMVDYDDDMNPKYVDSKDEYYFGQEGGSASDNATSSYYRDSANSYAESHQKTIGARIDRVGVPIMSRIGMVLKSANGIGTGSLDRIEKAAFRKLQEGGKFSNVQYDKVLIDNYIASDGRKEDFTDLDREAREELKEIMLKMGEARSMPRVFINSEELRSTSHYYSKNDSNNQIGRSCIESMFVDHVSYSAKGLLARAFPSYIAIIIDEQQDYIDRKKMWNNYYVMKNILDISIHQAFDSPVSTAHLRVSNVHENLSKMYKSVLAKDLLFKKTDHLNRLLYEYMGVVMFQSITDEMLSWKNRLSDEINLSEGARLHLRMGYGSNPMRYPTVFNGIITAVQQGEVVEISASSDGHELIKSHVSEKADETNKDLGLQYETSNIIKNILTRRENRFINWITGGEFKIRSGFGIEHFGSWWDVWNIVNQRSESFYYDKSFNDTMFSLYDQEEGESMSLEYQGTDITIASGSKALLQYDLLTNIYKGNYNAELYVYKFGNPFDGEANFKFFVGGRTPWDIFKMCEKGVPDFVCYPRYYGFESRLFYGLPHWQCKYKYTLANSESDDNYSILYQEMKSFSQLHECTSLDAIIDNTITLDSSRHHTNIIGSYTIGGDLSITPTIMSDHTIEWARQSTRTIDTTAVQNLPFVPTWLDKLINWSGIYNGAKNLAIYVCISELMNSWRETYTGTLLVLGQAEISAWDKVFIDDSHIKMKGMVVVREVVHHMSVESGFTTSIVPGMIVNNTLKYSGSINVGRSALAALGVYLSRKTVSMWSITSYARIAVLVKYVKSLEFVKKATTWTKGKYSTVKNFLNGTAKTKILDVMRKGEIGLKLVQKIKQLLAWIKTSKEVITATKLFNVGKFLIKGALNIVSNINWVKVVTAIFTIGLELIISAMLTKVIDMFSYRNTVVCNPLVIQRPDRRAYPLIGKARGGKNIVQYGIDESGMHF